MSEQQTAEPHRVPARADSARSVVDAVPFGVRAAALWSVCLVAIGAGVVFLVSLMQDVMLVTIAVSVSAMIAALLQPWVAFFVRHKVPRALAAPVVFLGGIAVLSWLMWFAISQIAYSKDTLFGQLDGALSSIRDWLITGPLEMTPRQADRYSVGLGSTIQEQFAPNAMDQLPGAITMLSGIVLVLFATLFMLLDDGRIWSWVVRMFPSHVRGHVRDAGVSAWRTLIAYMRALVLLAAINALAMVPVLWIADVPLIVPLVVLLFIGSLIPMIGVIVAGVVVCLVAFMAQGVTTAIVVGVLLVLIVQLFGNLLNPIILGKAVDIHPLAILMGVTAGTLLAGAFGAFVMVPLIAVLYNAGKAIREHSPQEAAA